MSSNEMNPFQHALNRVNFQIDETVELLPEQGHNPKTRDGGKQRNNKNNDKSRNDNDDNINFNENDIDDLNDSRAIEELDFLSDQDSVPLLQILCKFLCGNSHELVLSGLSVLHRRFMHDFAARHGLNSRSTGGRNNRVLHLVRRTSTSCENTTNGNYLVISPESQNLLKGNFLEMATKIWYLKNQIAKVVQTRNVSFYVGREFDEHDTFGNCLVPPASQFQPNNDPYHYEKMDLPITKKRIQLLHLLRQHSVIIISGETGSGKTTQVPQFLLDNATYTNTPCHIVVTQPRRIAAITVAKRVAEERGELCGKTVGFQVRLSRESSRSTCLVYTTSGSLLRAIMNNSKRVFSTLTHLIIDEIHERDKDTDFTLIKVKKILEENQRLKVILMSATMDINLLSSYFGNCPIMTVPGQTHEIQIFHLEDILWYTNYKTDRMENYLEAHGNDLLPEDNIELLKSYTAAKTTGDRINCRELRDAAHEILESAFASKKSHVDPLYQLDYYIQNEGLPIDFIDPITGLTPLMVACKLNNVEFTKRFLEYGAGINVCNTYGLRAFDYAEINNPDDCSELVKQARDLTKEAKEMRLDAYLRQSNIEVQVDYNLILTLIEGLIHNGETNNGAIIVFLPGYSDIIQLRDLLQSTFSDDKIVLYILHGNMSTDDQNTALLPSRLRKIILSTNIGQTSITIPDLVYVIDSGKIKMKEFDSSTESSKLDVVWISKADACQRSGRAGRRQSGICYRLYSKMKYREMSEYAKPEFLRVPLTEICLYAKTLRPETSVAEYLSQALNQPSMESIEKAINKLKILKVFTDDETVTTLGKCLADLPVDVHLGKSLLYSIFLRCYSSILTIAAYYSVKEPFIISSDRSLFGSASKQKKAFSGNSFSDPIGIISLYDSYMKVRNHQRSAQIFCESSFLSVASMEQFHATRNHLAEVVERNFLINSECDAFNDNHDMIRYALAAGLYPNLAYVDRKASKVQSKDSLYTVVQRTSAINQHGMKSLKDYINSLPYDWIIYYEKSLFNRVMHAINVNTLIPPLIVLLQCGKTVEANYFPDQNQYYYGDSREYYNLGDAGSSAAGDDNSTRIGGSPNCFDDLSEYLGAACQEICDLGPSRNLSRNDNNDSFWAQITIDNWIKFYVEKQYSEPILFLRNLLDKEFNAFMQHKQINDENKFAVTVLEKLLSLNSTIQQNEFN